MKKPATLLHSVKKFFTYLFYPTGVYHCWKSTWAIWLKMVYSVLYLPGFLFAFFFFLAIAFATFLPPLDLGVDKGMERTITNVTGNYSVTFVKSGNETDGQFELVDVELEPHGGNEWHYHRTFDEHFKSLEGEITIGHDGEEITLKPGEEYTAQRNHMHFFKNNTDQKAVLQVTITPGRGMEKTLRVAYGLAADHKFDENELPKNPWHLMLILGYSESYLQGVPGIIQEPLVNSLAKIAQWKGEDKELEKYYRNPVSPIRTAFRHSAD